MLVHEKVSVVLVAHIKYTPSINEWCKPSTTCTQNEYLAPLIVNYMSVLPRTCSSLPQAPITFEKFGFCNFGP